MRRAPAVDVRFGGAIETGSTEGGGILITPKSRWIAAVCAAAAFASPSFAHAEPVFDGPGRYLMVRTLDTGNPPSAEQQRRCREHFGSVRENTVAIELDAELFSFAVDQANGRVDDRRESLIRIAPGFICGVPSPGGNRLDTWGYTVLTRSSGSAVEVEFAGPCDLVPVAAQPGAAFFNCKLDLLPDLTKGILGGFATSNSVVNPRNLVPGNPTGSIWTFYLIEVPE